MALYGVLPVAPLCCRVCDRWVCGQLTFLPGGGYLNRVQSLQLHHELDLAHQGASTDLNGERARRRAWQRRLNCQVQQVALQLLFSVFREVKNHLNYEHRVFNSEEFLKTRAPGDQQFYRQVLDTYMFHSFLKARLSRRMDAFAQMDLHTQSEEDRCCQQCAPDSGDQTLEQREFIWVDE